MANRQTKAKKTRNLLILNYAMDPNDQVFAHQIEVVRKLAPHFESIRVITASENSFNEYPGNVEVFLSKWEYESNISNLLSFYKVLRKATQGFRNYSIFSHMTEVQSALILPLTIFLNIPHFLWYAHQSKSLFLKINLAFLTGIVTSTSGSCPVESKKVHVIGQGIDEKLFGNTLRKDLVQKDKLIAVHVGRIDKSKEIQNIIDNSVRSNMSSAFDKLLLIGEPTKNNKDYQEEIKVMNSDLISMGKILFVGKVSRSALPDFLATCDLFIHSFNGSLDKALVEATMLGLPVVTNNAEYQRLFGVWTRFPTSTNFSLNQEIDSFLHLKKVNPVLVATEIRRRRLIAINEHSLERWIAKLVNVLKGQ